MPSITELDKEKIADTSLYIYDKKIYQFFIFNMIKHLWSNKKYDQTFNNSSVHPYFICKLSLLHSDLYFWSFGSAPAHGSFIYCTINTQMSQHFLHRSLRGFSDKKSLRGFGRLDSCIWIDRRAWPNTVIKLFRCPKIGANITFGPKFKQSTVSMHHDKEKKRKNSKNS